MSTPGWYWQKTRWDNYRLIGPEGPALNFRDYEKLFAHCIAHGIDAAQI